MLLIQYFLFTLFDIGSYSFTFLCAVQFGHLLSQDLMLARGLMWDYFMGPEIWRGWLIRLVDLFVGLLTIRSLVICDSVLELYLTIFFYAIGEI